MNGHVTPWIQAYHDGQLRGVQRERVSAHLESCAVCQKELKQMLVLSDLLREYSAPQPISTPAAFMTRMMRRLPAPVPLPRWRARWEAAWQALPLMLMAGWILAQTVLAAGNLSLLGGYATALANGAPFEIPFASGLPGVLRLDLVWPILAGAPWLGPTTQMFLWITTSALLTLFFGILVWGWIASWWVSRRQE